MVALEPVKALAQAARERLGAEAELREAPLAAGAPEHGPYDAILVEGRVELRPQALLDQLKDGAPRLRDGAGPRRQDHAVRAGRRRLRARPLFDANLPGLSAFAAEAGFSF